MYSDAAIRKIVALHHDPKLGEKLGMVYQLWEDGEITLQKSGELLWQRTLHLVASGKERKVEMPVKYGNHSFAFMPNREIAESIRAMF